MAIPIGLLGSEDALRRALEGAVSAIDTGLGGSVGALENAFLDAQGLAQGGLDASNQITQPFTTGGQQAFDLQAALSGALGAPSQANAFARFQSSPGQQFLRDESEQALLRNASAIGGIGGGRVREALQQNAIGLAQQDFGNQFGRLGQVSGLGGQFAGRQAGAGLDTGQLLAGLRGNLGSQAASANLNAGNTVAQFAGSTGRDLSAGRTQAGRDISGNIGGATSALAQLVAQQGAGLGDILGTGAGNLSNILSAAGTGQLGSQTQLATILANLAVQQGSQLGGLTGVQGIQQTSGALEAVGNLLAGIGAL